MNVNSLEDHSLNQVSSSRDVSLLPAATSLPRVLLIDANAPLRRALALSLQGRFQVTTAATPTEGLNALNAAVIPFAVILTALRFSCEFSSLPYLDQLFAARNGASLIVSSGDNPVEPESCWQADRKVRFLPKPFSLADLFQIIAQNSAEAQSQQPPGRVKNLLFPDAGQ